MAQMGILVDREDGSRFSLNYNKETTKDLFRYARAERLFREGEKLRWCYKREYEDFYQKNMEEKEGPSRRQRKRINHDFVVEERTKLIDLGLSPGKCIARNTTCAILFARRENVISEQLRNLILLNTFFLTFPQISSYGSLRIIIYFRLIFQKDERRAVLLIRMSRISI